MKKFNFIFILFAVAITCIAGSYRAASQKLIIMAMNDINERKSIKGNCKPINLTIGDTANIKANIPIFPLKYPERNKDDIESLKKMTLASIIDTTADFETQIVVIKKKHNFIYLKSLHGLCRRWHEETRRGNFKYIPLQEVLVYENQLNLWGCVDYPITCLMNYIASHPTNQIFSIYCMDGLYSFSDNRLLRLEMTDSGITETDAEEYFRNEIISRYGLMGVENIICGASPEQLICI